MKVSHRKSVQGSRLVSPSAASAPPAAPRPAGDVVRVSDAARVLAKIWSHVSDLAATLGVVREERVAELRERVQTGQYRPDLHEVARRFLIEEFALAAG